MVLLASFPFVSYYLHDINCRALEAVWGDYVSSAFFREAALLGLTLVRQHKVEAWIADDRQLGPMEKEDLDWVGTEVLPALAASGLRRMAMVESIDWLNRTLIDAAYTSPLENLPIEIRQFTDIASARTWACNRTVSSNE